MKEIPKLKQSTIEQHEVKMSDAKERLDNILIEKAAQFREEKEAIAFAEWTQTNGWEFFKLYNGWKHFKSAHEHGMYKTSAELYQIFKQQTP